MSHEYSEDNLIEATAMDLFYTASPGTPPLPTTKSASWRSVRAEYPLKAVNLYQNQEA